MKRFIIFYTNYEIGVYLNNKIEYSFAFDFFEYDKKYEVIKIYKTSSWLEYKIEVSIGYSESLIIVYHYDEKDIKNTLDIQDGILIEYSIFPNYDLIEIDIQEERNKLINKILESN